MVSVTWRCTVDTEVEEQNKQQLKRFKTHGQEWCEVSNYFIAFILSEIEDRSKFRTALKIELENTIR